MAKAKAKKSKGRKGKTAKLSKGKKKGGAKKRVAAKRKASKKKVEAKRKAVPKPRITREPAAAPAFTEIAQEEISPSMPETPEEPAMGSTENSGESVFSTADENHSM